MTERSRPLGAALALLTSAGCGVGAVVPIVPDVPVGGTAFAIVDPTFEIVARLDGAKDPLLVGGTIVAYGDFERALNQAIQSGVVPRHDSVLTVDLVAAEARYSDGRIDVSLVARATLRTRLGNAYVAQTTVVCKDGAITSPDKGAKVMWSCMSRLGHDLGGWLAALPPNPERT